LLATIDLVVEDEGGKILLGKRNNRPAQGYWFVPGGRIKKNEKLADAMKRVSSTELGTEFLVEDVQMIGAFDHIYDDNYHGIEGINTHYVVLVYKVNIKKSFSVEFDDQHSEMKWWPRLSLLKNSNVHQNTKAYFGNI
jgi:colanic acid biosynthesis protein WcaH